MNTKWERLPTWRERIESGASSWDDYRRYRLQRLETADMEYQGLDDVIHTYTMPMIFRVVNPSRQVYITFT